MKVVYIIDHLRPDGSQVFLTYLAAGLASKTKYHQTIICLNDSCNQDIVDRLTTLGCDVRIIGKMSLISGYGIYRLLHFLIKSRFDVAVTFLYVSDVVGRVLAKCAAIPRIISALRARNVNYSCLQRWLVRNTINIADAIILNSSYLREFAIRQEGAHPEKIYVIPNGVHIERFINPINSSSLREQFALPQSSYIMGTVGRLTHQKGVDVLFHALALLQNPNLHLVVFGCGRDAIQLRSLVFKLGLNPCVHFAGYRRDLPGLLGAFDLYVHPARFEGMPNAVLEAMAAGCPIVATAVDGICELIEDGHHGWLIAPENPREMARAIDAAMKDPTEARRRGLLARARVVQQFSINSMISAWEAVLDGEEANWNFTR